jgi:hypothetical protein
MSGGRHSFKYNDATRLARAAKAAGLNVKGLELELECGKVTVLVGDDPPKPLDPPNPWEKDDNAQSKRTA